MNGINAEESKEFELGDEYAAALRTYLGEVENNEVDESKLFQNDYITIPVYWNLDVEAKDVCTGGYSTTALLSK